MALSDCAAVQVDVQRAAAFTPEARQRPRFVIEPMHDELLRVNDRWEEDWLRDRSESQAVAWTRDKGVLDVRFTQALVQHAAGIVFVSTRAMTATDLVIRPSVTHIEPRNAFAGTGSTTVDLTVQLVSPDGTIVDETTLLTHTSGSWMQLTITDQLRTAGNALGAQYGEYLRARLAGGGPRGPRLTVRRATDAPRVAINTGAQIGYVAPVTAIARIPRSTRTARDLQTWGMATLLGAHLASLVMPIEVGVFFGFTSTSVIMAAETSIPVAGAFVAGAQVPPTLLPLAIVSYAVGALEIVGLGLLIAGVALPWERPPSLRERGATRAWTAVPIVTASGDGVSFGLAGRF